MVVISYFLLPAVILAESINFVWEGMMKEEDDHYLYGREERDPRKRKRMSEEVFTFEINILFNNHIIF